MKDTGRIIRKGIFQALNGNISYNAANVPIFDLAPTEAPGSHYIMLRNGDEATDANNDRFVTIGSVLIDVATILQTTVTNEIVEDLCDQVLEILLPTPQTFGITLEAGFNLTDLKRESANYLPMLQTDTGKIVRKILRLTYRIQQS